MDFYIDITVEEKQVRTVPWLRKETVYTIGLLRICTEKQNRIIGGDKRFLTQKLHTFFTDHSNGEPITIYGYNVGFKWHLFNKIFGDNIPEYLPEDIIDIQAYANIAVIPKIDFEKLHEDGAINYIPTREMSIQEKKDLLRMHKNYPVGFTDTSRYAMRLHKFYKQLEESL